MRARFPLDRSCLEVWRGCRGCRGWGLALALILAPGGVCHGEPPVVREAVARVIRQRVDYGYSAGIAVGMINRDGRAFLGYGKRHLNQAGVPDERTLFEIGSVTKVLTCLLLADAAARGEVRMEDPVQGLLPPTVTMPRGNGEITLEQLGSQRSGLPQNPDNLCTDDLTQPFECLTVPHLYDYLNRYVLPREPGAAWEYSNTGMGLLGHALARRSGKDYETLLRERILDPLGMTSTRIDPTATEEGRVAKGYSGILERPDFRIEVLEGAGALRSTVDDMLTFLSFNLGLRETSLTDALNETHRRRGSTTYAGVSIGLGWWLWGLPGGQVVQHSGDTPGFTAFVGFHKGRGLGVVVLSNARANAYSAVLDVGLNLLDPAYPLTAIRRPAVLAAGSLDGLAGIYREPGGDSFEVGLVRDHLVAYHPGSKFEMTLYPESTRLFAALDIEVGPGTSARFQVDGGNQIAGMDWTQGGRMVSYARHADPARIFVSMSGTERRVSVIGGSGATYDVEASEDLLRWTKIGSVPSGEGGPGVVAGEAEASRYFRAARHR